MVCTVLPRRNTRDHYTHLTCKLGHWTKWDHYKHPLPSHSVPCWDGVFSLDHTRMCQQGLFKCQCVYDFYIFAWAVQVRPLHASNLKTGSLTQVRPLQASLIISLCALLGWCFLIRSSPWVSIWAPKGSVSLWLVQFWLAEQVRPLHTPYLKTGSLGEVRPLQAPLTITLCTMLGWYFLIRSYPCVQGLFKDPRVYGLYCFARTEQVRPLQASYLKTRSLTEVRPLHPFT